MGLGVQVLLGLLAVGVIVPAAQQPAVPATTAVRPRLPAVVRKTDVIYGRVQGAALLANLAYTETDALKPAVVYVFGGRWRAGSRLDNQGNWERLARWAEAGFFTMTVDHRLVGRLPAPLRTRTPCVPCAGCTRTRPSTASTRTKSTSSAIRRAGTSRR